MKNRIFIIILICLIPFVVFQCGPGENKSQNKSSLLTVLASPAEVLDPSWGMQSWRLVWDSVFDAVMGRFWNMTDENWSYTQFFGKNGLTGYHNPEVINLIEQITLKTKQSERERIYSRLNEIFREDVPLWMLAPSIKYFISNSRVQGLESILRLDPLGQIPKLRLEEKN